MHLFDMFWLYLRKKFVLSCISDEHTIETCQVNLLMIILYVPFPAFITKYTMLIGISTYQLRNKINKRLWLVYVPPEPAA